ncbi:MAG: SIS domain-containing protein [Acidimicrobiia bacterium]
MVPRRATAPAAAPAAAPALADHLAESQRGLLALRPALGLIERWGAELRHRLEAGARLLVAGNGGSAALSQHLVGEMVGRFDRERAPFSALALSAETAGLTAIGNDYGFEHTFARQVTAHGRPGDMLVALSTSGRSPNLLHAVVAARAAGVTTWAITGPRPNPLAGAADDVLAIDCAGTPCVQDVHQVAVHLVCLAVELAGEGDR